MDGGRGGGGSSRGGSQAGGVRGRGHLDIFDFNDFDDAASYASSRRSSAASFDEQSLEDELSPAQQEAKKREEDAALFMFGHLAKREGDDEEPSRASRARVAKKSSSKDPKERLRAKKAASLASSDAGGGSLKELWQQSSLRTSTMTGANQFDDWVPAKPKGGSGAGAASAGGHSSPISTASPYSAPSPRRGGRHHRYKQDDLFDDYYGGNYGSEEYEVSSAGESIPTVATAGNSLDEDEKGLPVPVTTLHHIFYPITLALLIAFLTIDYILADRVNEQDKCDTYQNAMAIALAIDFVVIQSVCVGLTYLFRYMSAEPEGEDEKDDGFYSELHPYEGEIREYFGLGDPTEGLKRNASMSGFGGTHTTASMASLRKTAYRPESENEHVHEWF
ncbi:transmembrane protein, putative [Bodo saltans]|uniref:Transmembrane protein, putative n=1 Tax=Bodo saltans TaxID=75058 RepID=A0A0S4J352_BODSA|nr:transmembrane protein, putative [Bodo saltans]|eukprot:CUG06608.1 transmembrane protein, putative [Bodo saltans]